MNIEKLMKSCISFQFHQHNEKKILVYCKNLYFKKIYYGVNKYANSIH